MTESWEIALDDHLYPRKFDDDDWGDCESDYDEDYDAEEEFQKYQAERARYYRETLLYNAVVSLLDPSMTYLEFAHYRILYQAGKWQHLP